MKQLVRQPWERLNISKATYYRRLKTDPKLPRLFKIFEGGRASASDEDELDAYMLARKQQQDA